MNSPQVGEKGAGSDPAAWSALSSNGSIMARLPALSDELEEQREHQGDDRGALEQHREQQAGAADGTLGLGLAGNALGNLATDATETDSSADQRQAHPDAGA